MENRQRTPPAWLGVPVVVLSLMVALAGCEKSRAAASSGPAQGALELLELRYQGAAGQVTYPELAQDLGYLAPVKLVHVGNTISGPQDVQTVATGDTDFGGAFNGAVLNLIARKAPIRAVIGLSSVDAETFNGFYVREDSPIRAARDLIGKKVAMNTLGAHHEFVLREYLRRAGLSKSEVERVTLVVLPPVNTEQALRAGQIDVAVLGGIHRDKALERGGVRLVFSDYELFGAMTSASYVVSERLLRAHPKTVEKFVAGTAQAIEWSRATPREQVIARMESIIHRRGRAEDASLVRYFRAVSSETRGGLLTDAQFQRWIDWLVREGQLAPGQLAPSALYTNQFNPYAALGAGPSVSQSTALKSH